MNAVDHPGFEPMSLKLYNDFIDHVCCGRYEVRGTTRMPGMRPDKEYFPVLGGILLGRFADMHLSYMPHEHILSGRIAVVHFAPYMRSYRTETEVAEDALSRASEGKKVIVIDPNKVTANGTGLWRQFYSFDVDSMIALETG